MTKLMIVDDDVFIRQGLKNIIDWGEFGIEVVAEADNGRTALELFKSHKPNIIITDIRMPNGNGLELIQSISQFEVPTRVIVLSGYDDFTYVRQAMRLGAEDYLLKPIDENELKEIIKVCCNELEKEKLNEQLKWESFQLLRTNLLTRWVDNNIAWDELKKKLEFLGYQIAENQIFQVCVTSWKDNKEGELPPAEQLFRSYSIYNCLEEAIGDQNMGFSFLNSNKQTVCIFVGQNQSKQQFTQRNLKWLKKKAKFITETIHTPWYSTIGEPYSHIEHVHKSYKEAIHLQNFIHYTKPVICIDNSQIQKIHSNNNSIPSFTQQELIMNYLISGKSQLWCELLEKDFLWSSNQSDCVSACKYISAEWFVLTKQVLRQAKLTTLEHNYENRFISKIVSQSSIQEIKHQLFSLIFEIEEQIRNNTSEHKNPLIYKVLQYLRDHYNEELTLQFLADTFYVSKIYLGRLFKKETGELFSDYLNCLRLNKAKELLESSHIKAADIALKVGFSDPNYFYRKFKKEIGLSPTEYRNLKN